MDEGGGVQAVCSERNGEGEGRREGIGWVRREVVDEVMC
jgi:hypothetical protein